MDKGRESKARDRERERQEVLFSGMRLERLAETSAELSSLESVLRQQGASEGVKQGMRGGHNQICI
jgi:hypothetical protein